MFAAWTSCMDQLLDREPGGSVRRCCKSSLHPGREQRIAARVVRCDAIGICYSTRAEEQRIAGTS